MPSSTVRQDRTSVKRRHGLAIRPSRSPQSWPSWVDREQWTLTERERQQHDWADALQHLPSREEQMAADEMFREDRSREALALIKTLRDEAGLVRSIIAPHVAEWLAADGHRRA